VQDLVHLVGQVVLLGNGQVDVARRLDPVEVQVGEQAAEHLVLEVQLERFLPAHHRLGQHVVHHPGDLWGSRTRPFLLTWPFTRLARIR
jgi:hypothetical protein